MATETKPRELFHAAHYNIIAKRFRLALTPYFGYVPDDTFEADVKRAERNVLIKLALEMAERFKLDNPRFDPVWFLTNCSPDPDNYSLAELWENV